MQTGIAVLIAVLFQAAPTTVDPKEERDALEIILPQFRAAWNSRNADALMSVFHPENRVRKKCGMSDEMKKECMRDFSKTVEAFGEAQGYEIRKYIQRKGRYVVRVTYTKKGVVPGTFAVKRNEDGKWLILDFNIDGQGEPELKD